MRSAAALSLAALLLAFGDEASAAPPASPAAREPAQVTALGPHHDAVKFLIFSPDGTKLVSQGPNQMQLWDVAGKKAIELSKNPPMRTVRFTPDGSGIFMEVLGKQDTFYDVATGKSRTVESEPRLGHTFSPDGLVQIRYRVDDATLHKLTKPFDIATADKGTVIDVPAQTLLMKDFDGIEPFTMKGDLLAVKGKDRDVQLWNMATAKRIAVLPKSQGLWQSFSPDGKLIVVECGEYKQSFASPSGVQNPVLTIFDTATGRPRCSLVIDRDDPPIRYVTFSPDSRLVASANNYTIKVWNATTGKLVAAMEKPKELTQPAVSFRKDGRMIAALSGETGLVWNAMTGKLVHAIAGCSGPPVFAPEGKSLAAAVGRVKMEVRIYQVQ